MVLFMTTFEDREGLTSRANRAVIRPTVRRIRSWLHHTAQQELKARKGFQQRAFIDQCRRFQEIYTAIASLSSDSTIVPIWKDTVRRLVGRCLPYPRFDFLSEPDLLATVVSLRPGRWAKGVIEYLDTQMGAAAVKELVAEDYVGVPLIVNRDMGASNETIEHLYHFARYSEITGDTLDDVQTVLEWGGGYGSQARIFRRLLTGRNVTYVIVDLPIMSALQWLFITSVLGEDAASVMEDRSKPLREGRINLVPSGLAATLSLHPDLFLSTWALGEAMPSAWAMTAEKGWLSAPHVLLCGRKEGGGGPFPAGFREWVLSQGLREEEMKMHRPGVYWIR